MVSKYDDVLADVLHKKGYKAGDTLRLILPFLKAYGATNARMVELSRERILLVPGAERTMRFVRELMQAYIVSTSYEHYVSAVCEAIGFPFENAYCTRVNLDETEMDEWEAGLLKNHAREIAGMPMIEIPEGARQIADFSSRDQETIARLDEIFWEEMTDLPSYHLILEVNPVGGEEKAASVLDICRKTGAGLEDTVYVGDSKTDVQAFKLVQRVRDKGGRGGDRVQRHRGDLRHRGDVLQGREGERDGARRQLDPGPPEEDRLRARVPHQGAGEAFPIGAAGRHEGHEGEHERRIADELEVQEDRKGRGDRNARLAQIACLIETNRIPQSP